MEITLSPDQLEEMNRLISSMAVAKSQSSNSPGEIHINSTKIEWDSEETKITISD
jgi:hypothetical protein